MNIRNPGQDGAGKGSAPENTGAGKASPVHMYRVSLLILFFMMGSVFGSWASRIPDIKDALHLNEAVLGSVLFALPVGQLSAMALSGYLVSRYGSKLVLTVAALLYPAALVGLGAASSIGQLTLGLFLFGITANLCNIAVNTQGVGVERLYNRSIMASFHGLWSLAGFCGGLVSTLMVGYDIPPLMHFCIIYAVTFAVLVTMRGSMLPRDAKPVDEKKTKKVFVRPDRYILLLGLIAFGSMACEGTMFDWSGVYFETVIRPPKELIRLGYIAFMCTMACGRFTADRLVTRFGAIRASGIVIATGLLLSVLFPHLTTATLGFLLVGFGTSSVVPLCYSLAGRSKTMLPGVALATVSTIGFFGFLLGPPVIGFIAHALNLRWSFALIALIGLTTTVAMLRQK